MGTMLDNVAEMEFDVFPYLTKQPVTSSFDARFTVFDYTDLPSFSKAEEAVIRERTSRLPKLTPFHVHGPNCRH